MAPDKDNSSRNACQRIVFTFNLRTFTFIKVLNRHLYQNKFLFHALRNKGFRRENVYNENPRRQISPLHIVSQVSIKEFTK